MNEHPLIKSTRDSLKTLLLHHQLEEKTRGFLRFLRKNSFSDAKSLMTNAWQSLSDNELEGMIRKNMSLLPISIATQFGLVMDDGNAAVMDVYLYFDGGHWISCGIKLVHEGEGWGIHTIQLIQEEWSPERAQIRPATETNDQIQPTPTD